MYETPTVRFKTPNLKAAHVRLQLNSSFDLRNNQRFVIGGRSVLGDWVEDLVGHVEKFDTHRVELFDMDYLAR